MNSNDLSESAMAMLEAALSDDDQSSASSGAPSEAFDDGYGSDLMGDDDDRTKLMAMPELQREQILLKRQEQRIQAQERMEAQIKWRLEQRKRRRPVGAEADRSRRTKKREIGKEAAIEDIRARRRHQIAQRQSETVKYDDVEDEDYQEDDDDDDGSGNDGQKNRQSGKFSGSPSTGGASVIVRPEHTRDIDFDAMRQVQIRRPALEKVLDEPFLRDLIMGMFARVSVGQNTSTGEDVYRAVMITDIVDYPRTYSVGAKETSKALEVRFGKSTKVFKMNLLSSHGITIAEAGQWVAACHADRVPIPTIAEAMNRKIAADKLRRTFKYTPEMVEQMVQAKAQRSGSRQGNITKRKFDLTRQLEIARESGDVRRVAEVEAHLDDLHEEMRTLRRRQDLSADYHNARVRMANNEVDSAAVAPPEMNTTADGGNDGGDPFQRRRTRPQIAAGERVGQADGIVSIKREEARPIAPTLARMQSGDISLDPSFQALVKAHEFPVQINVEGSSRKTTSDYRQMYPLSFLAPCQWSNRSQFGNTFTLAEWRTRRGLTDND